MDPLLQKSLSNYNNYQISDIEDRLEELYQHKKKLESNPTRPSSNIFNEVEKEFEGLTDEQKKYVYSDDDYQRHAIAFSDLAQAELIAFIKPRLLQNETVIKLLESQRDVIRLLKKQMNAENDKRLSDFKEYTEKYSDMTYAEYLKTKTTRE